MKVIARALASSLLSVLVVAAHAEPQNFIVNPKASSIAFALSGTGHEVHGSFRVASGSIQFDRGTSKISGSIVVSAASGDSGDQKRDKNMKTQVLDVEHFADVTFQPQSYHGTIQLPGDSSVQVTGIFILHGASHVITVPMQIHIDGENIVAKGSFIVPYVQWGLKDPSIFILKVAKEVHIDLSLVGTVSSVQ
jgi:polyisoprenoid-binding protein YceI